LTAGSNGYLNRTNEENLMRDNATHYTRGAHVKTSEGAEVGTIDRIVFDAKAQKITHIIVKKGLLLTTDRVIPVDALEPFDDGVRVGADVDPTTFPQFEQSDYVLDAQTDFYVANPSIAIGAYGPIGAPNAELKRHRDRNIPEDSIALHADSDVIASDGKKVGRVKEVVADTFDDRAVQLIVASGVADRVKRAIPANLVISITEGEIHLSIGSVDFDEYATLE
jgi:sporulation protein YlmC with PRC-barrel domain